MGREIRRVPANWEHPKDERTGNYIPLYEGYDKALEEFAEDIQERGLKEAIEDHEGGPRIDNYVQFDGQPAEWYQVYETVSEGTPVTPPFKTKQELIDYLVERGDFWSKKGWDKEAAKAFVDAGLAPSGIIANGMFSRPQDKGMWDK